MTQKNKKKRYDKSENWQKKGMFGSNFIQKCHGKKETGKFRLFA